MNEIICTKKHIGNLFQNTITSNRYHNFLKQTHKYKGVRPVWRSSQRKHHAKLYRYETNHCIKKHYPGIDFLNEDLTREKMFKYLEKKGVYYDHGGNVWNETVIIMNWHDDIPGKFENLCSRLFGQTAWEEDYSRCDHCYRFASLQPGYYGDQYTYKIINDCELICPECLKENPDWLIDDCLNDMEKSIPSYMIESIEKEGFKKWIGNNGWDFESGFHYGQNDTPQKALESVWRELKYKRQSDFESEWDFLFVISDVSQFDVDRKSVV